MGQKNLDEGEPSAISVRKKKSIKKKNIRSLHPRKEAMQEEGNDWVASSGTTKPKKTRIAVLGGR